MKEVVRRPLGGLALAAAWVLLGALSPVLRDSVGGTHAPSDSQERVLAGSAWEARRLLAQFAWLKVHAILHAGIEEKQRERPAEASRSGESADGGAAATHAETAQAGPHDHESHHDHANEPAQPKSPSPSVGGDGGVPTVAHAEEEEHEIAIPHADHDFRGVLGDLERDVKPYFVRQSRVLAVDPDQVLPLCRAAVALDPHFVEAYATGATFVYRAGRHTEEAMRFLEEGARNNPDSFEIQEELGHIALVGRKDLAGAIAYLRRGLTLVPTGRRLSEQEQTTLQDLYRWLALAHRDRGEGRQAAQVAREGLSRVGDDVILRKIAAADGSQ